MTDDEITQKELEEMFDAPLDMGCLQVGREFYRYGKPILPLDMDSVKKAYGINKVWIGNTEIINLYIEAPGEFYGVLCGVNDIFRVVYATDSIDAVEERFNSDMNMLVEMKRRNIPITFKSVWRGLGNMIDWRGKEYQLEE